MELTIIQTSTSLAIEEFAEKMATLNLLHYASEAAAEMEFDSMEELHESVKRAMELCLSSGISIKGNFQHVYKCFDNGLTYDWKLSQVAYKLVCLNGKTSNTNVARLTIQLIKGQQINHF